MARSYIGISVGTDRISCAFRYSRTCDSPHCVRAVATPATTQRRTPLPAFVADARMLGHLPRASLAVRTGPRRARVPAPCSALDQVQEAARVTNQEGSYGRRSAATGLIHRKRPNVEGAAERGLFLCRRHTYSDRNASIGSMNDARRAGSQEAMAMIKKRPSVIPKKVSGSVALIPTSRLEIQWVRALQSRPCVDEQL